MKLFTPEISWHQKEPIFSVDFCPQTWKLASCGADFTVKIWLVKEKVEDDSSTGIEFLANLDRHTKPVNVVRFSPNGKLLASAGDDGTIILWKLSENEKYSFDLIDDDDVINKESWTVHKMLRGHIEDVYDLAWSPDSTQLISGSVDNSAILWDAIKGQSQKILTDHKHYVQGVCWDPRNFYVATHSSDSTVLKTENYSKGTPPQMIKSKLSRMFLDETMQSFFRRCTFSPDGSFLFLPAGLCDGDVKSRKTTYVFARGHFKCPIRHLPGTKKATVAVKCSPIVYELLEDKENIKENNEFFKVPYRMIYAVASLDAVTFYDTQHEHPIGHCANMHYASITDMTWSSDGKFVVISSTDGYCSFVKFEEKELGTPIMFDPIEYQVTQAKIRKASKVTTKKKEKKAEVEKLDNSQNDDNSQKSTATPTRTTEHKEKIVKSLDRNQPTIEKLFVTPVRKRKRPSVVSPLVDTNKTPTTPTIETVVISPVSSPSSKAPMSSSLLSPLSHNSKMETKPPKRVQVVTLSTSNDQSITIQSPSTVSPAKPPKRAVVTTLATFTTSQDNSPNISDVKGHSPIVSDVKVITTAPRSTLMSPPPKRVSVTTLSTTEAKPCTLMSPPKPPKRVSVTSLSTTEPKPSEKTPKRASVTTITSFLVDKNKKGTEKEQPVSTPLLASPKSCNAKPPKRVKVTTLTTFDSDTGGNDKTKNNMVETEGATGSFHENTKSKTETTIEKKENKIIETICID